MQYREAFIHIRYYHVGEAVHDVVYHYHLVVHCTAKWSFVNSIRQMMYFVSRSS